ncbi:hypothetical protein PInf_000112 [Phytophthora infestans]|nr:hypothetical protein PInf_000112 [Phytophthora infestans]
MVVAARAEAAGVAGDAARESTTSRHGKDHLRLLPPSANWYCSKICDWGRSDEFGLLFAFGAKNSVFIYQVTSDRDAGVKVSFFAQLVRGKRDRRVTAVQFLMDTTGELRLVCGGEEGSVQIWDVASLTMIEQHKKHKAEVMAVTVSATLDANFVIAGDRQGRISAWERDAWGPDIRLWDLNTEVESGASDYQCDLLWKGLQSKVTFVRWHPLQHSVLAYGMEDGRIGIYDIQTKKYNHFRTTHSSEVRQLQWVITKPKSNGDVEDGENAFLESIKQLEAAQAGGQSLEEALIAQEDQTSKKDAWADVQVSLWSCDASGHLFESNADAVDQKSLEITDNCVAFKWDEQCEMVAIGRSNGAVELMETCGSTGDCNTIVRRFHEHLESVTKQKKEAASKLKKHGKVKQPQQVEPIAALSPTDYTPGQTENGQVVNTDRLHDPQTDKSNETSNKQKKKKQNMLIFHRETNLTSMEVASACSKIAGVKQDDSIVENTDTVDANMPVDSLLAHIDHTSLRDFFTSESKRFQDEREWESLANTLLIQGNIIEALRVVAKEGALTPTWLSYAPMAGMDVWREMTNLYAHQLDVQGDKKEAVSGEAFREALALIRSRLGPNDALLHNALWKYSDFLIKRGRNGEAALALLQIGSVKAKARAVNTLVNTADIECVKAALDVLMVSVQRPAEPAEQDHKSDTEELAFPASFFLSIAGNAVTKSRFDVAETAGQLLQSPLVGSSSASHRLTGCLLSIVKAINEHQLSRCKLDKIKDDVVNNQIDSLLLSCAPTCVREFFEFLTTAGEGDDDTSHFYDSMVSASAPGNGKRWMASRADKFWFQVLDTCRRCGYWFDADGEVRIQEAQNLLVEANCFSDIEQAVAASKGNTMPSLLQVAQKMLRFVIDVMSTSFIGALEHMREVLQLLTKGETSKEVSLPNTSLEGTQHCVGNLQVNVMTLLQPCGFASPNELPQCGELAEEQLDTLVLWTSVLLSQCQIALAASISTAKRSPANSERNLESMIRSLLHLLTLQFFDGEAAFQLSRGLMDAGNQSQIGELMNEILVAIHHLPEEPATQEESCDNASVEEGRSSKQALLIDANDMRSRLTWSEDDMKQ